MLWNGYDLPLGLSIAPEAHAPLLEEYVLAGFRHFELQMPTQSARDTARDMLALADPNRLRLEAFGLRPWSLHLPFGPGWDVAARDEEERRRAVRELEQIVRGAKDWGARVLTLHPGLEPVRAEERAVRILRSARSVRELRRCADDLGMRIALEDLPRTCLGNTGEELEALMDAAGAVGCCFDVNHLLKETHAAFLDRLAPRVINTHLSDYDGVDERHRLPGEGIVPFGLVAERLQRAGYRGPYLFELRGVYGAQAVLDAFRASLEKA